MALEGLRGYLELASGLTLASRQRAREVAASLVSSTGLQQAMAPLGGQVQQVAEELVATSRANRDLLLALVRGEVDRAVAALGVPSSDQVRRLDRRVTRLEEAVAAEGSPVRTAAAKKAAVRATTPDGTASSGTRTAAGTTTRRAGTAPTRTRATRPATPATAAAGSDVSSAAGTTSTSTRATRPATVDPGATTTDGGGTTDQTATGSASAATGSAATGAEAGP
jgi:hypothetical protein